MKAEELMIGDLLTFKDCVGDSGFPILKVNGILPDTLFVQIDYSDTDDEVDYEDVIGIPITPEILEKNGFITGYDGAHIGHDNNLKMYHKYIGKTYIVVNYLDDGKVGIEISNEFSPKDDRGRADLVTFARDWCNGFCVHELQHALRLCGIEKEIVI